MRNSTWFTRPFLLVRGRGLGTRLIKRDASGRDHVVRFTRPSGSVFAYCKRSKTGAGEGLGTRLVCAALHVAMYRRSGGFRGGKGGANAPPLGGE